MAESYSVTAVLQAIDKNFSKTFGQAMGSMKSFQKESMSSSYQSKEAWEKVGNSMKSTGSTMTKSVTLPVVAGFAAATKVGMEFEGQMSRVQAIAGANKTQLKAMTAQAKQLGADTAFSAKEAADGMENLASAGFDANQIMDAMPGLLDLAAVSGKDVAMSAENAAAAINQFGLAAKDSGHVADVFAKVSADTNSETKDLGYALKYAGTVANMAGFSFEETAAAIGLMSNAGIKGEQAGTTLRGAISRLMKPTKEVEMGFDMLGISIRNGKGEMYDLNTILKLIKGGMKNLNKEQQDLAIASLFGTNAMSGMTALLNQGGAKLDKYAESLTKADGSAKKMAKTMLDNSKGSLEAMNGSFETLAINVFENLKPAFDALTVVFTKLSNGLSKLPRPVQQFIVSALAVVAAVGPLLFVGGTLIKTFTGIGGTFKDVLSACKTLWGGLSKLFLLIIAHPFVAIIVALVAFAAWLVHLYKTNEEFRNKVNGAWRSVKEGVGKAWEAIKGWFEKMVGWFDKLKNTSKDSLDKTKQQFSNGWEGVTSLPGKISKAWDKLKEATANKFNEIKTTAQTKWNEITTATTQAWENLKESVKTKVSEMVDSVMSYFRVLKERARTLMFKFATAISKVLTTIYKYFAPAIAGIEGIWNNLKSYFKGFFENLKQVFKHGWDLIKTVAMAPILMLCDLITGNFDQMKKDAVMLFEHFVKNVKMLVTSFQLMIQNAFQTIKNVVLLIWYGIWGSINRMLTTALQWIIEKITQGWEWIKGIWEGFKTWVIEATERVKTEFLAKWNQLVESAKQAWMTAWNTVKGWWNGFTKWLAETPGVVQAEFMAKWNKFAASVKQAWKTVCDTIKGWWNGFTKWLTETPDKVKAEFMAKWNKFVESFKQAWSGMVQALSSKWDECKEACSEVIKWIMDKWNELTSFDISKAGKAIMDSFFKGLKAGWKKVTDFVGGIGEWIRKHKGPISYDKRLLIDNGKAIMVGLDKGIKAGFVNVKGTVGNVTKGIADSLSKGRSMNDLMNKSLSNPSASLTARQTGTITHELSNKGQPQPANIVLQMGDKTLKGFAKDIYDANNEIVDIKLDVF